MFEPPGTLAIVGVGVSNPAAGGRDVVTGAKDDTEDGICESESDG